MIFDEAGNLVWFDRCPPASTATNLQVQQLRRQARAHLVAGATSPPQGFGEGEEMIVNSSYQRIGRVHAGNGYKADLHDFHITPQGTALLTVFDPIDCDLSARRRPAGGAVTDSVFQEVDLRDRAGATRVAQPRPRRACRLLQRRPQDAAAQWPFDYFHINSIDQQPNGRTLISARNTWALYELDTAQRPGARPASAAAAPT